MQCPHCQKELPEQIREDYSQEVTQLREENRTLTNSLGRKDLTINDLQGELRALNTLLGEEGISWDAIQLQQKLDLVKSKLGEWTQLINHD